MLKPAWFQGCIRTAKLFVWSFDFEVDRVSGVWTTLRPFLDHDLLDAQKVHLLF